MASKDIKPPEDLLQIKFLPDKLFIDRRPHTDRTLPDGLLWIEVLFGDLL